MMFIKKSFLYQLAVLIVIVFFIFFISSWVIKNPDILSNVSRYGYGGVFILSIVSGFNFIVPIPTASLMPLFLSAGLQFPLLIIITSLGMTIADLTAYFIGRTGRAVLNPTNNLPTWPQSDSLEGRGNFWIAGVVFLFASFVPLPNELLIVPLALMGYRLLLIFPALILGNITFNLIASWGFVGLFNILA